MTQIYMVKKVKQAYKRKVASKGFDVPDLEFGIRYNIKFTDFVTRLLIMGALPTVHARGAHKIKWRLVVKKITQKTSHEMEAYRSRCFTLSENCRQANGCSSNWDTKPDLLQARGWCIRI